MLETGTTQPQLTWQAKPGQPELEYQATKPLRTWRLGANPKVILI
jgi:hypothetical protein